MKTISSSVTSRLLAAFALLGASSSVQAQQSRFWDSAVVTGGFSLNTNWDGDILPVDGDNLFFGPSAPGVAITAGTLQVNSNLIVNTLNITNAANINFQVQGGNTLTLNNIVYNSAGNHTISQAAGGTVLLGSNVTWDLLGGGTFTGLTVSALLSGTSSITKTGARALTLTGSNTFSGGIVLRNGTIFVQSFVNSNGFGTGAVTFGNEQVGVNNATVTISVNSGFTSNFLNAFINDNASATNVAAIGVGTNSANYTTTFSGNFSTGANYNPAQFLNLSASNGTTGVQNSTLVFSGDFSAYNAGTNFDGIRLNTAGNFVFASQNSIAPTNYRIVNNSTQDAAKLIIGGAFTVNQAVTFFGAAGGMRNSFGTRTTASTTTTLAGDGINALVLTDLDGANVFAQNSTSTLAITGLVSGAGALRVNDGYTFVSGSVGGTAGTNTLQTPTGIVNLSAANTNSGGVQVHNGTLLVTNTTGSGTGSGALVIGTAGAASTNQAGVVVANSRIITGVSNATAATLQIGQSITGTGLAPGSLITGITLGVATSTISISANTTAAAPNVAFGTTAFTTTATLLGTGFIDGATTINAGSTLGAGASTGSGGEGLLTFASTLALSGTSITALDVNGTTRGATGYDAFNVAGALTYGGTLSLFFNAPIQAGSYNFFDSASTIGDFSSVSVAGSFAPTFTGSAVFTAGIGWSAVDAFNNYDFTNSDGQLVISAIPEPSTYAAFAGVLGLGLAALRRRRNA